MAKGTKEESYECCRVARDMASGCPVHVPAKEVMHWDIPLAREFKPEK